MAEGQGQPKFDASLKKAAPARLDNLRGRSILDFGELSRAAKPGALRQSLDERVNNSGGPIRFLWQFPMDKVL